MPFLPKETFAYSEYEIQALAYEATIEGTYDFALLLWKSPFERSLGYSPELPPVVLCAIWKVGSPALQYVH